MTPDALEACCQSHTRFLDTCIDGNACEETAADERWVRILNQPHSTLNRALVSAPDTEALVFREAVSVFFFTNFCVFSSAGTSRNIRPIPIR